MKSLSCQSGVKFKFASWMFFCQVFGMGKWITWRLILLKAKSCLMKVNFIEMWNNNNINAIYYSSKCLNLLLFQWNTNFCLFTAKIYVAFFLSFQNSFLCFYTAPVNFILSSGFRSVRSSVLLPFHCVCCVSEETAFVDK